MTYEKTNWLDHIVEYPNRFKIKKSDGTEEIVDITPEPGAIIQQGTPVSAENLNKVENQLEKLSNPEYSTPQTITASIFTLANSKEGQVSVRLKGLTDENLIKSSNMDTDTDGDGVVDDFVSWKHSEVTGTFSFDSTEKAQKMEFSSSTADGRFMLVSQDIPISEGIVSYSVEYKLSGSAKAVTRLQFYDENNAIISETAYTPYGETSYFKRISFENISIPDNTKYIRLILRIDGSTTETGTVWYRKAKLNKKSTIGTYISSGVKSTVNTRLKVVKNLCSTNVNVWTKTNISNISVENDIVTFTTSSAWGGIKSPLIRIPTNTDIALSLKDDTLSSGKVFIDFYDVNKTKLTSEVLYLEGATTKTIINKTNTSIKYLTITFSDNGTAGTYSFGLPMLVIGSQYVTFEPYKESVAYYQLPEGVDGLHSLPNGTQDEITDDGKLIKRTKKYVLQASDISSLVTSWNSFDIVQITNDNWSDSVSFTAQYGGNIIFGQYPEITKDNDDDPSKIGKFATNSDIAIRLYVAKGTYADLASAQADLAGTTIIYQLAEEKPYDLIGVEDLYTFDGQTTIMWEPVIRFEAIADSNGQITIPDTNYPIDFIEKVEEKIVDENNISYIEGSYSQVDNSTIGGLTYGKKYRIVYHYPAELTTGPEMIITYPVNIAASLSDIYEIQRKLEEELGSVWITLLPLADKELGMYMIQSIEVPSSATTEDVANKINEILSVWKGE